MLRVQPDTVCVGRRVHLGCCSEFILAVSTSPLHQLTLEQIFSVFQNAAVFVEVNKGLGRTRDYVTPQHLVEIQKVPLSRSNVANHTN